MTQNADPVAAGEKSVLVEQLRSLLQSAEATASAKRAELGALQTKLSLVREASKRADAEVRHIASAIRALEAPVRPPGRPRGGDPTKTRELVRGLMEDLSVERWSSRTLQKALERHGHAVSVNAVSAALSHLAKEGAVRRLAKAEWCFIWEQKPPVAARHLIRQQDSAGLASRES